MGSDLVSVPQPENGGEAKPLPQISYTEIFEKHLPYYLSIGMTWEDFWQGDAEKAKFFRAADKIRRRRKNEEMWLQGRYIYEAVGALAPIIRFSTKPQKPLPYPAEPFPVDKETARAAQNKRDKQEAEENIAAVKSFMQKFNATRGGNNGHDS